MLLVSIEIVKAVLHCVHNSIGRNVKVGLILTLIFRRGSYGLVPNVVKLKKINRYNLIKNKG